MSDYNSVTDNSGPETSRSKLRSAMLTTVEGIYRDGKVELLQSPTNVPPTRVLVTFLPAEGPIDLRARGIDQKQAAELRWGFGAAAEDWDRPEMDVYNDL